MKAKKSKASKIERLIVRQIGTLYTLQGVAAKQGRRLASEDLTRLEGAAMICDNGTIQWIGPDRDVRRALKSLPKSQKAKEVSLKGQTVLPAFVDCHTHLIFAGDRKHEFEMRNQGATYQEIAARGGGIRFTVEQTRKASAKDLSRLAEERAERLLAQGVTAVEIKSGYGLDRDSELKILKVARGLKGIRTVVTFLGPHAVPTGSDSEKYVGEVVSWLPDIKRLGLADRVDMFVEAGYFSVAQARHYFRTAKELGFQLTAHADQMTRTGAAIELAALGAVSVDHCVQISNSDADRLAASDATCVLLPTSDFYLKMKYPPARELLDRGARVALSTDFNPGTSPTLDIGFVGLLARLEMRMTQPEVLAGLTWNGAKALGLEAERGTLAAGKAADFLVLEDDLSALFFEVGHHPIRQVWRQGRPQNLKKS